MHKPMKRWHAGKMAMNLLSSRFSVRRILPSLSIIFFLGIALSSCTHVDHVLERKNKEKLLTKRDVAAAERFAKKFCPELTIKKISRLQDTPFFYIAVEFEPQSTNTLVTRWKRLTMTKVCSKTIELFAGKEDIFIDKPWVVFLNSLKYDQAIVYSMNPVRNERIPFFEGKSIHVGPGIDCLLYTSPSPRDS